MAPPYRQTCRIRLRNCPSIGDKQLGKFYCECRSPQSTPFTEFESATVRCRELRDAHRCLPPFETWLQRVRSFNRLLGPQGFVCFSDTPVREVSNSRHRCQHLFAWGHNPPCRMAAWVFSGVLVGFMALLLMSLTVVRRRLWNKPAACAFALPLCQSLLVPFLDIHLKNQYPPSLFFIEPSVEHVAAGSTLR